MSCELIKRSTVTRSLSISICLLPDMMVRRTCGGGNCRSLFRCSRSAQYTAPALERRSDAEKWEGEPAQILQTNVTEV